MNHGGLERVPARLLAACAALTAAGAALAGCGGPPPVFGDGQECDDASAPGVRAVAVEAAVSAVAGEAPSVWAGFQRRDGTPVTSLPRCFDGTLQLVLADPEGARVLEAEVERTAPRAVEAADGDGVLLVRDSASFDAELLGEREGGSAAGSFAGWYVHLDEPAAGTYTWDWPLVWRAPPDAGGGEGSGTVSVRVVVEGRGRSSRSPRTGCRRRWC